MLKLFVCDTAMKFSLSFMFFFWFIINNLPTIDFQEDSDTDIRRMEYFNIYIYIYIYMYMQVTIRLVGLRWWMIDHILWCCIGSTHNPYSRVCSLSYVCSITIYLSLQPFPWLIRLAFINIHDSCPCPPLSHKTQKTQLIVRSSNRRYIVQYWGLCLAIHQSLSLSP